VPQQWPAAAESLSVVDTSKGWLFSHATHQAVQLACDLRVHDKQLYGIASPDMAAAQQWAPQLCCFCAFWCTFNTCSNFL
jgi:hypothetical protein